MHGQIMVATSIIGGMPVLQGLGVMLTLRRLRIWRGNPPVLSRRISIVHWWIPLLANVLIALFMLWALPSAFGFNLHGFLRSAPDWGSLAVFSGVFALGWGIIRSKWVASALRRGSACLKERDVASVEG